MRQLPSLLLRHVVLHGLSRTPGPAPSRFRSAPYRLALLNVMAVPVPFRLLTASALDARERAGACQRDCSPPRRSTPVLGRRSPRVRLTADALQLENGSRGQWRGPSPSRGTLGPPGPRPRIETRPEPARDASCRARPVKGDGTGPRRHASTLALSFFIRHLSDVPRHNR